MSWVAVAIGTAAVGGSVYKAVQGNQQKQTNKGFIEASYANAKQAQNTQQSYAAEGQAESLNQRGLATTGYSPIHAAMSGGMIGAPAQTPGTLGEQRMSDTTGQFQLEDASLDNERKQALQKNKVDYENTLIGSIVDGVEGVAGAVGDKQAMNAAPSSASASASPAASMTLSGDSSNPVYDSMLTGGSFQGIHPVDPLNNPSSSWNVGAGNAGTTRVGQGESNATFTV